MTYPAAWRRIMASDMEPVLISFHAPVHDLDQVAHHVVREGLSAHPVSYTHLTLPTIYSV